MGTHKLRELYDRGLNTYTVLASKGKRLITMGMHTLPESWQQAHPLIAERLTLGSKERTSLKNELKEDIKSHKEESKRQHGELSKKMDDVYERIVEKLDASNSNMHKKIDKLSTGFIKDLEELNEQVIDNTKSINEFKTRRRVLMLFIQVVFSLIGAVAALLAIVTYAR